NGEDEIRSHQVSVDMVPEIHNYTTEIRHVSEAEASSRRACMGQFKYRNRIIPKMLQKSKFLPRMGLGLRQQGPTQPVSISGKKAFDTTCLGYNSTHGNSTTFRKKQEDQGIDWIRQSSFQKWFVRKGEEKIQHQAHQR
ncbi:hypothetical protein MKW92_045393, partial [Papaver armeniacum]